ncbi:MAG: hypothetical protein CME70_03665 [Halobacteriovorax sp.]|nr:hypothetical protein [Halobacteriovorax sp.]|tara:strand:+ start:192435 stop:193067 length:633 start_codon:yes stop_codon:yes gene_type:complete
MNNAIENLVELAKPFYEGQSADHDFDHINRVMQLCLKLGEKEKANLTILKAAALLHDVVSVPKNHPKRTEASRMAAEKGVELMKEAGFDDEDCRKAFDVILEHSFSLGKKPSSIESAILQDADRIDALGAIGVMRMVSCGAKFKAKYYESMDPFALNREYDDKKFTLDHFYTKLFKLPDLMNTDSGKEEAAKRVSFMKKFVEQLKNEIYF